MTPLPFECGPRQHEVSCYEAPGIRHARKQLHDDYQSPKYRNLLSVADSYSCGWVVVVNPEELGPHVHSGRRRKS